MVSKLIEPKFKIEKDDVFIEFNSNYRRNKLKRLIRSKKLLDAEAHNSLSGLIVENKNNKNKIQEFDAMWCSSLAD